MTAFKHISASTTAGRNSIALISTGISVFPTFAAKLKSVRASVVAFEDYEASVVAFEDAEGL